MIHFTMDSDLTPLLEHDLIYLGSPYTKYSWGIDQAAHDVGLITGRLMARGLSVFSPIVHAHYVALASGIEPLDHDFWMKIDTAFMKKSDALLVCQMSGWDESHGVSLEMEYFDWVQKPIYTLNPGFVR